jgi:hypothetical protein
MSETVVYSPDIVTENERLLAVYSLLEQMRLEHNRVGEIALSNWKEYQGKWAQYARVFRAMQLPLLQEQNRLKDAIRRANYTDEQWQSLSHEQAISVSIQMYCDRIPSNNIDTKATSGLLSQLKSVDFLKLEGQFVDPTEDFTTFTEVDSASDITVTATKVSWDTMARNAVSYVNKDYGVDHFVDFEHLLTINTSANDPGGACDYWNISNESVGTHYNVATHLGILLYHLGEAGLVIIMDTDANHFAYWGRSAPFTYYVTLSRNGTDVVCRFYGDAGRTNLLNTLSIAGTTRAYRYLSVAGSWVSSGSDSITGYSENLDLQEAGGETARTSADSCVGVDSRSSFMVSLVRADTGGASDRTHIRGLASGDVGLGVDIGIIPGQKNLSSGDTGRGGDTLKALVAASVGSDMKLPGRQGHVTKPSKGVSL